MHAAAESIAFPRSSIKMGRVFPGTAFRVWAFGSLVIAIILCLAGKVGASPSDERVHDRPHVSVWHAYRGDEERALHEVLGEYERFAGAEVDVLAVPFEAYGAKLAAAVPRNHGP